MGDKALGCILGFGYEGRARALAWQLDWRQGTAMKARGGGGG